MVRINTGDTMRFSYKNAAIAVIIFTLTLTTILILIAYRNESENNISSYTLKEYNGAVALFKGDEVINVYDGVILSTLPRSDRQMFTNGITIKSPDEAQNIIEDYDG